MTNILRVYYVGIKCHLTINYHLKINHIYKHSHYKFKNIF